jgi:hypothetical protein
VVALHLVIVELVEFRQSGDDVGVREGQAEDVATGKSVFAAKSSEVVATVFGESFYPSSARLSHVLEVLKA